MTELVLAKITQKGQMTIPQEIREALEVSTGDYVVLRPLLGGVFLSKATVSPEVRAEDALRHLVTALGKQAEAARHPRRARIWTQSSKIFSNALTRNTTVSRSQLHSVP